MRPREELLALAGRLAEGATVLDEPYHRESISLVMQTADEAIRELIEAIDERQAWIDRAIAKP